MEGVGAYGINAAYVDANRGENPVGTDTTAKSLVECAAIPKRARADDFRDVLQRRAVGYRVSFRKPRVAFSAELGRKRFRSAAAAICCRLLQGISKLPG